jgi:hypothetical protein
MYILLFSRTVFGGRDQGVARGLVRARVSRRAMMSSSTERSIFSRSAASFASAH